MNFKERWTQLDPTHRKWITWGSIAVTTTVVLWASAAFFDGSSGPAQKKRKEIVSALTDHDPRAVGIDAINATIRAQGAQISKLAQNQKAATDTADALKQVSETNKQLQEQLARNEADAELMKQQLEELKNGQAKVQMESESKSNGSSDGVDPTAVKTPSGGDFDRSSPSAVQKHPETYFASAPQPPEPPKSGSGAKKGDTTKHIRTVTATEEEVDPKAEKEHEMFLPAGSILSGALITGMDAPTGQGARKEPFPALLRIKKEAILPNRFRADIRECFLIASGFGDLSSERAYLRAEVISCVREDGGVIETKLDAYAAGEDGKAGVRGRLVSKQGQILARSLMAGFMQGVSEAFSVKSVPTINVRDINSNSDKAYNPVMEQALNGEALQGAAISGTGKALERIADFYLEMAESLYPVIEVDALREIDFIVKRGQTLKLQQ